MSRSIIPFMGGNQHRAGFQQRDSMIERIENML